MGGRKGGVGVLQIDIVRLAADEGAVPERIGLGQGPRHGAVAQETLEDDSPLRRQPRLRLGKEGAVGGRSGPIEGIAVEVKEGPQLGLGCSPLPGGCRAGCDAAFLFHERRG